MYPNVIIAGAPKCGTSSLFSWLSEHPEVCVSSRKETRYFMDPGHPLFDPEANFSNAGLAGYARFFTPCIGRDIRVVLEATPGYIDQETAVRGIPGIEPRPLIIFVLRKPSERIYSAFQYAKNNLALLPKEMSFREFIAVRENGGGDPACLTLRRLAFSTTSYAEHLAKWIAAAGRANIRIFLFEDLKQDQVAFMRRLSRCIGIAAGFWDTHAFTAVNASWRTKSPVLHRLARRVMAAAPAFPGKGALIKAYALVNTEKPCGPAPEDLSARAGLDELFRPMIEELETIAAIDLSCWK